MTTLQDMTIKDGVLQSNYEFFDPWLIPAYEYEYWANKQFSGRTPSQIIDDYNESVKNKIPIKPRDVQNSLMAFTRNNNELTPKQKSSFLGNFGATIGWGTMLGANTKTMMAAGLLVNLIDGLCGDDGDNTILIIVLLSVLISQQQMEEMLKKNNEIRELYGRYKLNSNELEPAYIDKYITPKTTKVEKSVVNMPKLRPNYTY